MFDDIIRNKANEHEAPVPPDAWDNIAKQKKKRRFGFFWLSSMILLLCGLAVTGYLISKKSNTDIAVAESKTKPAEKGNGNSNTSTALQPAETKTTNEQSATKKANDNVSSNDLPAATVDEAKNNGKIINGKISVKTTSALPVETENITAAKNENKINNNKPLLAANGKQKKKFKGKAVYKNTGAEAEEINARDEKEKPATETAAIAAEQKNEIKNPVENDIKENKTTATIDKNLPTIKEEAKATTETKKENTSLTKQTKKHHWFIDAGITPLLPVQQYDENISYNRTLFLNNNLSVFSAKLANTSIDPSMAFGISVRRELNKKFTLGIGLQYLLLKENITVSGKETNTSYTAVQRLVNGALVADTVVSITEGTRNIEAVNSYHLFSVPVFAQYYVVQKRSWSLSPVAGVYVNISSSYQNEINRNALAQLTATPAATNSTNIGLDVFAGLRFGKTVGNKIEFFAMPAMRWNLGGYNIKNSVIKKTINQAGLSVGISYKVK